jgi:hypothetical protein
VSLQPAINTTAARQVRTARVASPGITRGQSCRRSPNAAPPRRHRTATSAAWLPRRSRSPHRHAGAGPRPALNRFLEPLPVGTQLTVPVGTQLTVRTRDRTHISEITPRRLDSATNRLATHTAQLAPGVLLALNGSASRGRGVPMASSAHLQSDARTAAAASTESVTSGQELISCSRRR